MTIDKPAENIAILSLMMVGTLIERLNELGQLDEKTARHLHHLVAAVRKHTQLQGGHEFDQLFNRVEDKLTRGATSKHAGE